MAWHSPGAGASPVWQAVTISLNEVEHRVLRIVILFQQKTTGGSTGHTTLEGGGRVQTEEAGPGAQASLGSWGGVAWGSVRPDGSIQSKRGLWSAPQGLI